jgi:cobyrinic acid a,c-diamide synthase
MKRLLLAAPASGAGKTTLTTGLLAALAARGLRLTAFKCGPDFVDPMFHREVLGAGGCNLDFFLASPEIAKGLLCRESSGADVSLIEGAMGYYDGVGGTGNASAWHVATATDTPAVLVVHPKGVCLTLAAMISGLIRFRENSRIRGIILNRCGDAFARKLTPMLEKETGLRVYGHVPEMPEAAIASRHLGLATPDTVADLQARLRALAARMEQTVDVDGLLALAGSAPALAARLPEIAPVPGAPVRIAVARDAAFCFYYRENLGLLRDSGAELVFFSPLADARLPEGTAGLYLGGGYPELHADRLAANAPLRREIRDSVASGLPALAEGGGFLYLQSGIVDTSGETHPMVGLLDGVGRNAGRPVRFGYATLRARGGNLLCKEGEEIIAHEFHYWDSENTGNSCIAEKASGSAPQGCVVANDTLFAGFPHIYFWSNPQMARRFVEAAVRRRNA